MKPDELIKAYNHLVAIMVEGRYRPSYGRRGGFVQFTRKNLDAAATYLLWFDSLRFAPRVYLVGAFAVHGWCYQPKWINLQSDRYVAMYRSGEAARWFETVDSDEHVTGRRTTEELPPAEEILKNQYRHKGKSDLCRMDALAGGYKAASPICQECPVRGACSRDR
jgi:hypothetical protein